MSGDRTPLPRGWVAMIVFSSFIGALAALATFIALVLNAAPPVR